jgi:monoamine oxidase
MHMIDRSPKTSLDNFAGTDAAPEGGYQAVTDALAAKAEADGAVFRLGETIIGVAESEGAITVKTTASEGQGEQTYSARTAVCTIPLGVLKTLPASFFSPALKPRKAAAIESTHVGELAKVVLTYPSVWWPAKTGSFTIMPSAGPLPATEAEKASAADLLKTIPLVVSSFASGALPKAHPTLLTYVASPISALIEALPTADVAAALHAIFASNLPVAGADSAAAPEPTHAVVTSWSADPFSRGATSTPNTTGASRSPLNFLELGRAEWAGRLGFAGEATDVNHRGSVTGACVSGEREATRVAGLLQRLKVREAAA